MTSERQQRLQREFERMQQLRDLNRGALDFVTDSSRPPVHYRVTLRCAGLRLKNGLRVPIDHHEVDIFLGPQYPDRAPDLQWRTAILHPNIKGPAVCAGLLDHWDSETTLDVVTVWLWDMARYRMYTPESYLNEDEAKWARNPENAKTLPRDKRDLKVMSEPDSELPEIKILDY